LHISDTISLVKNNSHVSSGEDVYLASPFGPGIVQTIFLSLVLPVMKGDDHLYPFLPFNMFLVGIYIENLKSLRQ
jgi:hypothetical protein